ncbi:MAG: sigma-54 dependent transcriptional regulator [Bdellovibrionales bacterium]|nr:sigma-54 dependent transcriptional regulator [Bdellovibrionales bacterium]
MSALFKSPIDVSVQDPSGEIRTFRLSNEAWAGRSPDAPIPLRDPTVPPRVLSVLRASETEVWVRAEPQGPSLEVGDLKLREACIPVGVAIRVGESELRLLEKATEVETLPSFPSGVRPWMTKSTVGRELLWMTRRSAKTPLSVYLAGETGSGKEVLAQLIHSWSERASGQFVPLNCAALSLSLVESELFGHVKGAFTGAHQARPGALLQAHNGTLFLDEVGDLPADIQVKLLRFLENGEIRAVGSDHVSHANVRVICATHKPLKKLVEEGKFRRDLYYRLASVTLEIPALRHRPEDIAYLAETFARQMGKSLSRAALLRLQGYSWPGNVRELRHALERACALSSEFSSILSEAAFDFLITPESIAVEPALEWGVPVLKLDEMERYLLIKALKISGGNRTEAAKILGIARSTLFEMLKRHRITGPRKPLPTS